MARTKQPLYFDTDISEHLLYSEYKEAFELLLIDQKHDFALCKSSVKKV